MRTIGEKLDDLLDRQINAYLDNTAVTVEREAGNETGVKPADTNAGSPPFQPLKTYRVRVCCPQVIFTVQAVSQEEAEEKAINEFLEDKSCPIVEEITEIADNITFT